MSIHHHLDYESDIDDPDRGEELIERFVDETNASTNAVNYEYLLTEEDGCFYVNELGTINGRVNGRRALITDEIVIEGVLEEGIAIKLKKRYESLSEDYSNSSS